MSQLTQPTYEQLALRTLAGESEVRERLIARPALAALIFHIVSRITTNCRDLDLLKRCVFYGKDLPEGFEIVHDINFVQRESFNDSITEDETIDLVHAAIGQLTEAGEFAEGVLVSLFSAETLDTVNLLEEIGDSMWYSAIASKVLDSSFAEIQSANIAKLRKRYPNKFTADDALNRDLVTERAELESVTVSGPYRIMTNNPIGATGPVGSPGPVGQSDTSMVGVSKPPLGVMPERLWKEDRMRDLARAIQANIAIGQFSSVEQWSRELSQLTGCISTSERNGC